MFSRFRSFVTELTTRQYTVIVMGSRGWGLSAKDMELDLPCSRRDFESPATEGECIVIPERLYVEKTPSQMIYLMQTLLFEYKNIKTVDKLFVQSFLWHQMDKQVPGMLETKKLQFLEATKS